MAFPFGGGLALIRPQFGRSIRVGGVGTPVYGTLSQFEPSGVARFRTQPDAPGGLSPAFSVDWTTSTSLPAEISLSRASSGTYFDSSGVLQTATSNTPRFDYKYNGTSWVEAGLLIEEQRTNLNSNSDNISTSPWFPVQVTVGTAVTSLDGTSNAYPIIETSAAAAHLLVQASAQHASAAPYTMSAFLKASGRTQVAIRESSSTGASAIFTLTGSGSVFGTFNTGSVTVSNAQIINLGGGWYRASALFTPSTGLNSDFGICLLDGSYTSGDPGSYSYTGDGVSGVIVCFPQIEVGNFPTSYIKTTSGSVTRSADIVSSTDAGLLAAQAWVIEVGELPGSIAATLLGINTAIGIGATSGNALTTADGGSQTTANTGTWTGLNRGGLAWDSTPRVSIDLDGGAVVTAANTPVTPTSLYFGNTNNGASDFLNGHLRMMAAYSAVTDSQLPTLSVVGAPFTIGPSTTSDAVGAAAGISTVAAVGASLAASTGSAAGTSTVAAVGASLAAATASAAGTSTVTATGKALFNGVGSAAGTSTVTATGAALANGVGNAAGASTVLATGQSTAASVGSAAGTSTDAATGSSLAKGVGNAAGASTATALAASGAIGTAAGISTVTAVGASLSKSVGSSSGIATVLATSASLSGGVGTAAGTSTVTATGQAALLAVGTAAGASTVAATGRSLAAAVGNAAGVGTAAGASPSLIMQAVGLATGSSIIVGVGNAHRPGTWQIAVRGTMDIPTPWKIGNTAIDTIPTVPGAESIYSDSTPDIYDAGDIYSQTAENVWKVAARIDASQRSAADFDSGDFASSDFATGGITRTKWKIR